MIKKYLNRALFIFSYIFFDPRRLFIKLRAAPDYFSNLMHYQKSIKNGLFNLEFWRLRFYTYDKYANAGSISGAYFLQDIWAAKKVYESEVSFHVDVASRIDGFVAHLLPFCTVEYIDIRVMQSPFPNLVYKEGSILSLPYEDNSIDSLSCLHVIEHIGLGRFGDEVDPDGYIKAAHELVRILKPGGKLYIGTPVGRQSLFFDAHRVFNVETVEKMFESLDLLDFAFVDDIADKIIYAPDREYANSCRFGCGLFVFKKKDENRSL
jgi:SAM-dependent methyltransferase